MRTLKLIKLNRVNLLLVSAGLLLVLLAGAMATRSAWTKLRSKAAFLLKAQTAVLVQTTPVNATFTVRSYGGKCLEFGAPHPLPHQAALGSPVFISDCNGTAAQQVRIEELPGPGHAVILHAGNGVIGRNVTPVVILQAASSAQAGASSVAQAPTAAQLSAGTPEPDQIPLEVQAFTNLPGQKFLLDGDSIILAEDRNLVVEVQNHRGANGTPLVLGHRDLDDSEFWTFAATDGSVKRPTSGFVRISQTDNSADGELRARADFLNAVFGAKWGTVIELDPNVSLNLADTPPLPIPAGVTIRGDRRGTNPGPELVTANKYAQMLDIAGHDVRITGLRLRGPSTNSEGDDRDAIGINAHDDLFTRTIIDHNEMSAWTYAAVRVTGDDISTECNPLDHRDPRSRPQNVLVARNFIHHNERDNNGYGVSTYLGGYAMIEGNTFVANRHAVTGEDGRARTSFRAWYNLVLSYAPCYRLLCHDHEQDFDMHGTGDPLFGDHRGGTGGQYVEIARNTFLGTNRLNFNLRGEPCFLAEFHHNISLRHLTPVIVANSSDPLWPAVVCSADCGGKLKVYESLFGAPNPTARLGVGDFDGDGKDDLFLATGAAWYYAPAGIAEWRFLNAQTDKMDTLLFGDFDGDGRTDVFTQHGFNWDVSWGGASQWEKINVSGPILGNAAIGDFDGNGRADVFYADGHDWFVSSDGVGVFHALDASGYRVSELRFGDFDGDGKTDVFTVGKDWQVSYGGVSGWRPLPHKLTGSVAGLIVADFNGDGRADVATQSFDSLLGWVWKISYGGVGDWTLSRLPRSSIAAIGHFDGNAGADLLLWNGDDVLEIDSGGLGTSRPHSRQDMR